LGIKMKTMIRPRSTATPIFSTLRALIAMVVIVAQVGVAGAGVLDAREGVSAASHLENSGTNLHFAHNEADCFMCRAQHLGDSAPLDIAPERISPANAQASMAEGARVAVSAPTSPQQSRAPPRIV
jgi:hypothetical protein